MLNKKYYVRIFKILIVINLFACIHINANNRIKWKDCLDQPSEWYGSAEAIRIADNVLLYQTISGGWP